MRSGNRYLRLLLKTLDATISRGCLTIIVMMSIVITGDIKIENDLQFDSSLLYAAFFSFCFSYLFMYILISIFIVIRTRKNGFDNFEQLDVGEMLRSIYKVRN